MAVTTRSRKTSVEEPKLAVDDEREEVALDSWVVVYETNIKRETISAKKRKNLQSRHKRLLQRKGMRR
ncbi:hypothetical protein HAX54_030005, partial [Datura stramonium]|nr:hypothetical protein [Datura stramonium]